MNRHKQLICTCGYCMIRYRPQLQAGIIMAVCPNCKAKDSQETMYDE